MRSALIAALILTSTVPSASAQDAARHRRYRIVVDEARGLSSAEAGWALTWATDRLNGRCARPGPASERHPLELRIDRRGRVQVRRYRGPEARCVTSALADARFPLGRAAMVRATLEIHASEPEPSALLGGNISGVTWRGPARASGDDRALLECRSEDSETYDLQVTIDDDGTLTDVRIVSPTGPSARCVTGEVRAWRFTRPSDAPAGPITLRVALFLSEPTHLFGGRSLDFSGFGH